MSHPGIWTFVGGALKRGETYKDAAYREVEEETGIKKNKLRLLRDYGKVLLFDPVYQDKMWHNRLLVFYSSAVKVKTNFENKDYRWAGFDDILNGKDYTNIFVDKDIVNRFVGKILHYKK